MMLVATVASAIRHGPGRSVEVVIDFRNWKEIVMFMLGSYLWAITFDKKYGA